MSSPREVVGRLVRRLPKPVRERVRATRILYRSARYRVRERVHPIRITRADIEGTLRELGLKRGDAVFVQTEMSALGTVEGGPDTAIAAFRSIVGEEGLIAMPAFPNRGISYEYLRQHPVFDVRTTPSQMGAITERFRRMPGTVRSIHPTHSISAQGPGAGELVGGHERAETPFGEGTPFARLIQRNAIQVFFGSGVRPMTMYHAFECLREPPFPFDTFMPERVAVRCIDAAGQELEMTTLVHRPQLSVGRIDASPRVAAEVRKRLIASGMRCARLGRADVLAQPLQEMLAAFEPMLEDGVTIYDLPALEETRVG